MITVKSMTKILIEVLLSKNFVVYYHLGKWSNLTHIKVDSYFSVELKQLM